ncbi:Uncharacterised protein [uncultured archaeon]|nr:Uncharacterised protein [uncultured archaeon]
MKKLLILWTILAFCVSTVSALQVSSPVLAGEPGADVNATFTITNDADYYITKIDAKADVDSILYYIHFENLPSSLAPNQSATVTVKATIPVDFAFGKRSIGSISVKARTVLNAKTDHAVTSDMHTIMVQSQSPIEVTLPVAMSAANDFGQNTPDPGMPIIGQWHVGVQDNVNDITVNQPYQGSVDAGWVRIHSNNYSDYWVGAVAMNCGGNVQVPPNDWINGGKIQTGPNLCDNQIELQGGDAGWVGIFTKPEADGKLIFVIAENKCGGSVQSVPSDGVVLGKVSTGPNVCDGKAEGIAFDGTSLDAGSMNVVYVPIDHTPVVPVNFLPTGEFEKLDSGELSGWAFDNDTPSSNVRVYVDGDFWKELHADFKRSDLVGSGKIPDKRHGFKYEFTNLDLEAFGNGNHTFNVYAMNLPEGDNPLLNGSPKVLAVELAVQNDTPANTSNATENVVIPNTVLAEAVLFMENTHVNLTNQTNQTNQTGTNQTGTNQTNSTTTNSTTSTTTNTSFSAITTSSLSIDRVKVNCNKLATVSEGSNVDAVPGQICNLTVRIKNTGSKDIDDIYVEANPDNSDVSGDNADISTLDSGHSEEKTLELVIDEDAENGNVEVVLTAEGEDTSGVTRSDTFSFALNIERAKHDLQVSSVSAVPKEASLCEVSRIDVTVSVENKGLRDEDKTVIELSVPGLGFSKKLDYDIAAGEEQRVYFTIPVDSKSPAGTFKAAVKTFYDTVVLSNSKTFDVVTKKCEQKKEIVNREPVVTPPPHVDETDTVYVPPAQEQTSGWFGSAILTGVLVLANLIALTVLGVMTYGYLKRPEFIEENEETVEAKDYY